MGVPPALSLHTRVNPSVLLLDDLDTGDVKASTLFGGLCQPDVPPVGLGNLSDDVQPESRSPLIGGVSRLENPLSILGRDAGPVVGDVESSIQSPNRDGYGFACVFDRIAH